MTVGWGRLQYVIKSTDEVPWGHHMLAHVQALRTREESTNVDPRAIGPKATSPHAVQLTQYMRVHVHHPPGGHFHSAIPKPGEANTGNGNGPLFFLPR